MRITGLVQMPSLESIKQTGTGSVDVELTQTTPDRCGPYHRSVKTRQMCMACFKNDEHVSEEGRKDKGSCVVPSKDTVWPTILSSPIEANYSERNIA